MLTPPEFPGATTDAEEARRRIATARGILLDWDGCAAASNQPHEGALTFIRRYRAKLAIVSNNSTLMPDDISDILAKAGVNFPGARIFLAGVEALATAARLGDARTLVLASPRMKALAHRVGVRLVQTNANQVVLLRDTKFTYAKLERAVHSLRQGARLIVSNPDSTHPGPEGRAVPETGALLAAIGTCVDLTRVNVQIIGKPSSYLFERACAALKVPAASAVMVGDNRDTDIKGAVTLGMAGVLVAPGSQLAFTELMDGSSQASRSVAMRKNGRVPAG